jgi:signal transduction histidine kinase
MNALLHAFEGRRGGTVTVRVDSPGPGRARLVVADDGVGMDDAVRRRIFDPFFTTRLGRGGSGLGMNIAQSIIVRILHGTIAVDSQPGQGSRFVVEFPCSPTERPVDLAARG